LSAHQRDGTWCIHEFTWQMDAILFWRRFQGPARFQISKP
jgi:hypothetical protein